ncbi:MAG: hypothetical protein WKH64_12340 [Chloroflexia bacterium]
MTGRLKCEKIRLPRKGPQQANLLRHAVPMGRLAWDTQQPGCFEVDLVYHSGDVATGRSERAAVMGRSARAMQAAFSQVLARLPYPIVGLHPDNGAEFGESSPDPLLRQ